MSLARLLRIAAVAETPSGAPTRGIVRHIILLVIANALWAASAAAQSTNPNVVFGEYQQISWQERDGLPQNTVVAIATTRDGYLWVGTYEGAARFDGVRFTLFNPSTTTGIGNLYVTSLLERRDGDLWLATYGGGVSRLSGGHFTQYAMRDGLSSDFVWCLFEDNAGTLWIGTEGGGVNAFSRDRFTVYTIANGLPSNVVRAIIDDGNGGLLVGTNRGIARIADGRVSPYEGRADVAHADISMLARQPDGSFWVATISGGLYRLDSHGMTEFRPDHGWANDRVQSLFADDEGRMWVGTTNNGLFRYSAGRFERYTPADGLPGARVQVIARDVDNSLWIGTDGGLVRFKKPRVTVYTQRDGLAGDVVGSIFQDAEGSVWAEAGYGLTRFVNGAFKVLTTSDGLPGGRPMLGSSADRHPLVYTRSGLARWTHDRFVQVREVDGIPWDRVTAVFEDRSGTLWLGISRRWPDSRARWPRRSPDEEGWPGGRFRAHALRRSSGKPVGRNPPKRRDPNLGRADDVMVRRRWPGSESCEGVLPGRCRDPVDWHARRRPQPLQGWEVRHHLGASGALQRQRLSDSRRR